LFAARTPKPNKPAQPPLPSLRLKLSLQCALISPPTDAKVAEMAEIAAANNLFGGQCTVPRVTQEFMGACARAGDWVWGIGLGCIGLFLSLECAAGLIE